LAGECKHEFREGSRNPDMWVCVKCGMVVKGYVKYLKAMDIKLKKSMMFVDWTEDEYSRVSKITIQYKYDVIVWEE